MRWNVRLRCADWGAASRVVALNASRGGLFLATSKPPPVGSALTLLLELPDGTQHQLAGTVRHVISPERALAEKHAPGVGVEIDAKHASDLAMIEDLARQQAQAGQGPVQPSLAQPASGTAAPPAQPPRPSVGRDVGEMRRTADGDMEGVGAEASPPATVSGKGPAARAVGIDFGTSYSSISAAIGDTVQLLADERGHLTQPTLVGFPEGGAPVVGWDARRILLEDPRRVVNSSKRLLGQKFSDPKTSAILQSAAFATQRGIQDAVLAVFDGKTYRISDICALVMSRLKQLAERQLGQPVSEVVLTAPVGASEAFHAALRKGAEDAKLQVLEIIEEPVAAALAYGIGQEKNEVVAVYDFGGGTFDFSIVNIFHDHFRVLGCGGDPWLGGDDFDNAMAQSVADRFWQAYSIELRQKVVEWQRLLLACESAKRRLSEVQSTDLLVQAIVETPQAIDIHETLERAELERTCQELLERSLSVCRETLDKLGLEPLDMTEVVVVGGVSKMPMIRDGVSRLFDREIVTLINPDEAVALGAGVRAALAVGHPIRRAVPSRG